MTKLEIFFDFLSPFSYLAVEEFTRGRPDNLEITWRPVVMGNLIHAYETKGPAEIAPKRDYLFRQVLRIAKRENIEIHVPQNLPFNSGEALRICLYWMKEGVEVGGLVLEFFRAAWARGEDLGKLEVLDQCMRKVGLESGAAFADSGGREIRLLLKENLNRALAVGAFGVPTFYVHDEIFWGRDSLIDLFGTLRGVETYSKVQYQNYLEKF